MKKRRLVLLFFSVLIALSLVSGVHSTEFKLTADDGAAEAYFGTSVAIDGDYAIVGAPSAINFSKNYFGSAYIFQWDGTSWTQQAKLSASDAEHKWFGFSVAIDGDYAIVGAPGHLEYKGSAYIFKWDGTSWTQQAKLTANDGALDDRFGFSVAIDGDYAIVSASCNDNDKGVDAGSAYIFQRVGSSWQQQAKLTANDGAKYDHFGIHVAIDGDYAIVSAPDSDGDRGSAYIFQRVGSSWQQQAKLTTDDGWHFGGSVAIDGDNALVGAPDSDGDRGSAYIFQWDGTSWTQQAKLTASDAASFDLFGLSVAIDGDYALIGTNEDDTNIGSAYIFKWDGTSWTEQEKLMATDRADFDYFGGSVAIDGDYALIGARYDDNDKGDNSGSAYIYDGVYPPKTWFVKSPYLPPWIAPTPTPKKIYDPLPSLPPFRLPHPLPIDPTLP